MAGLTNIKNQALTERIEDHLFQYILDERLAVGAKLPNEYELADRFGVSRGTIREAVKLLVSRGVLRVKHGSGTYVASLMPLKADPLGLDAIEDRIQLALDLTDVRLMLEPTIAELAARNRTEEEAQRLTEYCDAVRRRIQAGEDYLIEDMRFHWYLALAQHGGRAADADHRRGGGLHRQYHPQGAADRDGRYPPGDPQRRSGSGPPGGPGGRGPAFGDEPDRDQAREGAVRENKIIFGKAVLGCAILRQLSFLTKVIG